MKMEKVKIAKCVITLAHPKSKKPIQVTARQLVDLVRADGEIEV